MKTILFIISIIFGIVYHAELYNMFPVFWQYMGKIIIIILFGVMAIMWALFLFATYRR
jgi:hypothetical protein